MLKKDEARKGDAKTSTTQTSMHSTGIPNKSKNYKSQHRLSGQAPPWPEGRFWVWYLQKGSIGCCANVYPELKNL